MSRSISVLLIFFALPIHAAVTGTVVDASGAPIANARVVAFDPVLRWPRRERVTVVATMSDAKGMFALDVPGRGVVDVSVRADGYAPADVVTAISDPAGTIVLTKAKVVTFNITTPDGGPLADANVVVYGVGGGLFVEKTDAAGNARVPDITQWAEAYEISHDGYEIERFTPEWAGPKFRLNPKTATPDAPRTAHIRGVVRDAEKTPLRGIVLIAITGRSFADASTDANGAFDIAVSPGTYELQQIPGPYIVETPRNIDTSHGDAVRDFVATRLVAFDGKVQRSDGSPVPLARIRANDATNEQTMSNAAGTFRIYARPAATLVAQKMGLPAASVPADKSPLKIVIGTPAILTGIIHDAAHKPMANVGVYVNGAYAVSTKPDGTFSVSAAQGTAVVKAGSYPFREVEKKVEVSASTPPLDITLVKQGDVKGSVVDADGKPAAGVHMAIGDKKNHWSDGSGNFTFQFIDEGPATIRFGPYLTQTQDVTVPSEGVRLVLTRTRRLHGKVIDAATHAPIPKFAVTSGDTTTPFESAAGEFDVEVDRRLPLTVSATKYFTRHDALVQESDEDNFAVLMQKGRTIRGRVLDEHGTPMEGVTVSTDESMQTAKDGRFEEVMTTGGITFEKTGYASQTLYALGNDDPHTMEITLHRGITITGTVFDKSGAIVPDAEVTASTAHEPGGPWSARTDASGNFHFDDLPSTRYDFIAEQGQQLARGSLRDVDVERSGPLKIIIEHAETATIFGRVTGIDADSQAFVVVTSGDLTQQAVTERGGAYRIANAPTGLVEVVAHAASGGSSPVSIELKAGSERQVDLTVTNRVTVRGIVTWNGMQSPAMLVSFGDDSAKTTNDGVYELAIAPGEYDVKIHYRSAKLPFAKHVVVTGDAQINFDVKTSELHIVLVDADTKAPVEGDVAILDRETKHREMSAMTDANGRTGFGIMPGRPITLRASSENHASVYEDVAPEADATITIALKKSGTTSVRIVDARNGSTIIGELVVRDANGTYAATTKMFNVNTGTLTINLTPGRYQFSSSADGYGSATITAEVPAPNEIRVPLPRGGALALRASSDVKGTARLIQSNGQPYVRCWCNGIADISIDGRMTLVDRIAPGDYTLEIAPRNGKPHRFPVTVVEGQTVSVSID